MKAIRWVLKWGLISLISLITLIFVLISGGANPIINSQIKKIEQIISESSQRPVTISHVDLRAFPNLVLEVDQLSLGEFEGSDWTAKREALHQPLSFVEFKQVAFRFKLWKAMVSLGQDLELEAMNVDGLHITLHRNRDGRWNFEDGVEEASQKELVAVTVTTEPVVDAQPKEPKALKPALDRTTPEKRARSEEELKRFLSALKLSGVGIKDLKVKLIDEWELEEGASPRVIHLATVDLAFPRLELMDIIEGSLSASIFEERTNLNMSFKMGPLSALFDHDKKMQQTKVEFAPFPIDVSLETDALSLQALTPYVPADTLARLENVVVNGGFKIHLDPKGEVNSGGEISLKGLQLKDQPDAAWGPEIEFILRPQLLVSVAQDLVDLNGFSLQLNEMALLLNGQVLGISSDLPQIKGLSVETKAVRLERLLSLAPPVKSQLPAGTTLAGPLDFNLKTSGNQEAQQVNILLDLTQAELQIPEQFSKPAGVAVRLLLEAGVNPQQVQLKNLEVQLSDLILKLNGVVQSTKNTVSLKGGINPFSINQLVRLIPSVQSAIPPEVKIAGVASLELDLQQSAQHLQLDLSSKLEHCQLDTPNVKLIGGGQAQVNLKGNPSEKLNISVLSDLKGLTIKAGEAFDKPAGVPLDVKLKLEQSPTSLNISQLEAHLASLDLIGQGQQTSTGFELNATLKPSPLGPLIALAPSASHDLSSGLKQSRLGFKLKVKAGQGSEDFSCVLDDFSFNTPKSDLKGQLSFKQPSQPVIAFNLSSSKLDLDELSPPSSEAESSAESTSATDTSSPESSDTSLLTLNGSISVKQGQARGINFKDLKAVLALNGPKLKVSTLQVDVFKGQVKAAPLMITLPSEEGSHFDGQIELKKIDLEIALKELAPERKKSMAGILDARLRLNGEGQTWEELSPTLEGDGTISLERGILYGLDPEAAIINELARKVPGVKKQQHTPLKLKTLKGKVKIKQGAIHLQEPIDLETSEGPLRLEGAIGLNQEADLKATLSLSPQRLSKQLGKPIPQKDPIKVPFRVQGPLSDPQVSGIGIAAVVAVAAVALGGGAVLKVAEEMKGKGKRALKEGKEKAERALKRSKERVNEELEQKKKAAELKAKEAKAKAQAEAEAAKEKAKKQANDAKKKAEKKAKNTAKKLKSIF